MGDKSAYVKEKFVDDLIEHHGEGAYTYILARMAEYEGDEFITDMWRKIIDELDKYFKQGEAK